MNPQQLHTNSAAHTHDFSFYDHRRGEDVGREHVRESDLLNTVISFPSTSAQPFLLPRSSLQERIPGNFFIQGSNSSTVSFDVGASRDGSEQLMNSRDVPESTIGILVTEKLRDKQPLSSIDSRYDGENILARFASDNPGIAGGGRGALWPFSDRNDCIRGSVSATSESSLQLPISTMRLGENIHNFSGAHNILSTMLQGSSDPGGGARYASGVHCRDGLWADDHGTELLLLPGISSVGSENQHQNIPHQVGRAASVLVDNLKPLSEYLNVQSSDQVRQQNPSFHGFSTFAATSTSSLRDFSLSLSAQENSQHVLYRGSGSLTGAGSTCSNLQNSGYLKAAQKVLGELCSKAVAEAAAGIFPSYGNAGVTVGLVNAVGSSDLSSARAEEAAALVVRSSDSSSSLPALQQLRSSLHQAQAPAAAMAHQQEQLQDHYALVPRLQNDHLQVVPFMDRSQLELRRRRLFIMLEELEKRFKRYEEQMQVLVIALETSGVGLMLEGAAPYKEVAGQAIQKRFTYLRDAILASETFIMGGFSGDGAASSHPLPGVGECDQAAATRFRLLDQQLRHQRALQQVGLFPQPPWRPQRGLPERSVSLLRAWLFDHFLHPYPKDTEKVLLARQTGLTRNQVSNWFINARVRLWKPMVEEMYQEEMKTADVRRTSGQGNPKKFIPTPTHSSRNVTGTSEFHLDQSKKHAQADFDNHVMAMQDLSSMSAMQGIETSRFFDYKHNEIISDSQPRPFHNHQDEQVSFAPSIEVPAGKAAISTMLDAAQQCGTHTWPFIQHQNVSFDAQEQQHYCNSDISAALMRFGSSGGVTLTLGLQQHSSGGGSMNCAGPSPFERSPDDVNAAHRWCE